MGALHKIRYEYRGLLGWALIVLVGLFVTVIFIHSPAKGATTYSAVATPLLREADTRDLQALNREFAALAKAVTPAVVNISTTRIIKTQPRQTPLGPFLRNPFFRRFGAPGLFHDIPRERLENSLGSGVVVGRDGLIVTNAHLIEKASEISVLLSDKRSFKGTVIGTDPTTDVAVVKIDADSLPALPWGDSDQLQVGENVVAVGNPFGLNQTVTRGIVSAVGRTNVAGTYGSFIQTDAAINPGNSGGALVNIRGELIGVNTMILSPSGGFAGVGFAIPSRLAREVMTSLLEKGRVVRGWLGVGTQEITPELAAQFNLKDTRGALIADVTPHSPAEQAALHSGDVIIEYDSKTIADAADLRFMVGETPVGKTVPLKILRQGRQQGIQVKIGEYPQDLAPEDNSEGFGDDGMQPDEQDNALGGLVAEKITPDVARRLAIGPNVSGVVITEIDPSSAAATTGIRAGDVIMEINRQPVSNAEEYGRIARAVKQNAKVLLRIYRDGGSTFVVLSPAE